MIVRALDRLTASSRRRSAEALFWGGTPRRADQLAARLFYTVSAREWRRRGAEAEHLAPFLSGLERCRPPRRALDLGTGAGATAAAIALRHGGAQVYGVDGAARMVAVARTSHRAANLEFRQGPFEALPFPAEHFDLICALNALPELNELARVASPDAELLIANTYFGQLEPAWLERLRESGWERIDGGGVSSGSWQLLERRHRPD